METPTWVNPLGAKGAGESGTIGSIPAVLNAVIDALAPFGVRHLDGPATPQRVWQAMELAASRFLLRPRGSRCRSPNRARTSSRYSSGTSRTATDPGDGHPGARAPADRSDARRSGQGVAHRGVHLRLSGFTAGRLRPRTAEPTQVARRAKHRPRARPQRGTGRDVGVWVAGCADIRPAEVRRCRRGLVRQVAGSRSRRRRHPPRQFRWDGPQGWRGPVGRRRCRGEIVDTSVAQRSDARRLASAGVLPGVGARGARSRLPRLRHVAAHRTVGGDEDHHAGRRRLRDRRGRTRPGRPGPADVRGRRQAVAADAQRARRRAVCQHPRDRGARQPHRMGQAVRRSQPRQSLRHQSGRCLVGHRCRWPRHAAGPGGAARARPRRAAPRRSRGASAQARRAAPTRPRRDPRTGQRNRDRDGLRRQDRLPRIAGSIDPLRFGQRARNSRQAGSRRQVADHPLRRAHHRQPRRLACAVC